jgi:hypothetical protein
MCELEIDRDYKFASGALLKHRKTGGMYRVLYHATMESDLKPYYVYAKDSDREQVWLRPKAETEDGRFVMCGMSFS